MERTQACLSRWQINWAEIFFETTHCHASEENLSRLASFINAFCLFDRIIVPEKYRTSRFLADLDPGGEIFVVDSRVFGDYEKDEQGQLYIDVDPALRFKNGRNLKPKSEDWLKQHLLFDLSKKERDTFVNDIKKRDALDPQFYNMVLAEYHMMFRLGMLNEACAVLFASVAQVFMLNRWEIPAFIKYLEKEIRKVGGAAFKPDQVLGIFHIEWLAGDARERIKTPCFFEEWLIWSEKGELPTTLKDLRRVHAPLRDKFRKVFHLFRDKGRAGLVPAGLSDAETEDWNGYVDDYLDVNVGTPGEALLIKRNIASVELHASMRDNHDIQKICENVKGIRPMLKLTPASDYMGLSRKTVKLAPLGIETVIPLKRSLQRVVPGYDNGRKIINPGVATVVNFPVTVSVQLMRQDLKDEEIATVVADRPPHLYMICTRPRISVGPTANVVGDFLEIEFRFEQKDRVDLQWMMVPIDRARRVKKIECARTELRVESVDGEERFFNSSLLCQSFAKLILPKDAPPTCFNRERLELSPNEISFLNKTDLEIVYIGQSRGEDFKKTAIERLTGHEKWRRYFLPYMRDNPHLELWIVLLTPEPPHYLNMLGPGDETCDHEIQEMMSRTLTPTCIDPVDSLNFVEAAMINYFKPRFNRTFVDGVFPSRNHDSYERLFAAPIDFAAFELVTHDSLACRLYSPHIKPDFVHIKASRLNSAVDVEHLPSFLRG